MRSLRSLNKAYSKCFISSILNYGDEGVSECVCACVCVCVCVIESTLYRMLSLETGYQPRWLHCNNNLPFSIAVVIDSYSYIPSVTLEEVGKPVVGEWRVVSEDE